MRHTFRGSPAWNYVWLIAMLILGVCLGYVIWGYGK